MKRIYDKDMLNKVIELNNLLDIRYLEQQKQQEEPEEIKKEKSFVGFFCPKGIIKQLDQIVKAKNKNRTIVLIDLIENYISENRDYLDI